jgi:hypothetical protein
MTWNGCGLAAPSKSSSSTRVAWRLKTEKFTPVGCTVAPNGEREPALVR